MYLNTCIYKCFKADRINPLSLDYGALALVVVSAPLVPGHVVLKDPTVTPHVVALGNQYYHLYLELHVICIFVTFGCSTCGQIMGCLL